MFKEVVQAITDVLKSGIADSFYATKRRVFRSVIEIFALSLSVVLVVIGALMLAVLYMPLDILAMLLIIFGLLGFSTTVLVMKLN